MILSLTCSGKFFEFILKEEVKPRSAMQETTIGLDNLAEAFEQMPAASESVDNDESEIPFASPEEEQPTVHFIDKMSRIILPASCLLFNIVFFTYYL